MAFVSSGITHPLESQAQTLPAGLASTLSLPAPGTMITPTKGFTPAVIKAMRVFPDNPLKFDFIIDTGQSGLEGEDLKQESYKLIKYFLASLTVPGDELWVNLSPYEPDRMIPEKFGVTEMGRDLLAQDYILKQLTASLIYPEEELGQKFWDRVYKKAYELYGTTEIPVNTFNKVWVVPDKAIVYEGGDIALVTANKLKVMLESDYAALNENINNDRIGTNQLAQADIEQLNDVSSDIVRNVILPEIEKEVNEGEHFANLRQIYNSLILAAWYKETLKENLFSRIYANANKVDGIDIEDKDVKQKIYDQYLAAFQRGVYDYIKQDYDPVSRELIPRKYFSGGMNIYPKPRVIKGQRSEVLAEINDLTKNTKGRTVLVRNYMDPRKKDGVATGKGESKASSSPIQKKGDPKPILAQLVGNPPDYDWEANKEKLSGVLDGYRLGNTRRFGNFDFTPFTNFPFQWLALDSREAGWSGVISDSGVKNGIFEFTVQFDKEGQEAVVKIFQIGRYTRDLRGVDKAKGKTRQVLDMSDELGLRRLSELVKKPVDYDWRGNKKELDGILNGYRVGETKGNGRTDFNPLKNYPFPWSVIRTNEAGWKGVIIESGVKNGVFEFTVQFDKEDRESVVRTFQIGRYTRDLKGDNKEKGKTRQVLDMSDALGLHGLSEFVQRPADYEWKSDREKLAGILNGYKIGKTNGNGQVTFNPLKDYPFYWSIPGITESGWEGIVVESGVKENLFEFTAEFTKDGQDSVRKTFQIGRYTRKIAGQHKEKGKSRVVLDISHELGVDGLRELVQKPSDYDWEANKESLPKLDGYRIGTTNLEGIIGFSPITNFPFKWRALGFGEAGWEGVIIDSGVKGGVFEFTVEFTKEGQRPIKNTYVISHFRKVLKGERKESGSIKEILKIFNKEQLEKFYEKEIFFSRSTAFVEGGRRGVVEERTPQEEASFKQLLGAIEAVISQMSKEDQQIAMLITFDGLDNDQIMEELGQEVQLTEEDVEVVRRTLRAQLKHYDINPQSSKNILAASDTRAGDEAMSAPVNDRAMMEKDPRTSSTVNGESRVSSPIQKKRDPKPILAQLVGNPPDYDWEANKENLSGVLDGYRLEHPKSFGRFNITPFNNYRFRWSALGFLEAGWSGVIFNSGVKNGVFEFTVKFDKEGRDPVVITFQIGRYTKKLKGGNKEKGKTPRFVLDISKKLGLRGLGELVQKPVDYDWRGNKKELDGILNGYRLGKTAGEGQFTFNPLDGYPFQWWIPGITEAGWEGIVIESGVKEDLFEFTVEFTKDGQEPIRKIFQIGRYTRKIAGRHKEKGNSLVVLDISHELGVEALRELVQKPSDYDWEANKESLPKLEGYRIGATNLEGNIDFNAVAYFPFKWPALSFPEDGWEGVIIDSGVKGGVFEFTVKFTKKGRKSIKNTYVIGHFKRVLRGEKKEFGNKKEVLNIFNKKQLEKYYERIILFSRSTALVEGGRRGVAEHRTPFEETFFQEFLSATKTVISQMSKEDQQVAMLIIFDDLDNDQIMEELGQETQLTEEDIDAVRQTLREQLKQYDDVNPESSENIREDRESIKELFTWLRSLGVEQEKLETRMASILHYTNYKGHDLTEVIQTILALPEGDEGVDSKKSVQAANMLTLLDVDPGLISRYSSKYSQIVSLMKDMTKGPAITQKSHNDGVDTGYEYVEYDSYNSEEFRRRFFPRPGQQVLDVLGGKGDFVIESAQKYHQVQFTMIDANAANIRDALKRLEGLRHPLDNVTLILDNIFDVAFDEESFDWVTMLQWPSYSDIEKKRAPFMEKLARKVVPAIKNTQGRLILVGQPYEGEILERTSLDLIYYHSAVTEFEHSLWVFKPSVNKEKVDEKMVGGEPSFFSPVIVKELRDSIVTKLNAGEKVALLLDLDGTLYVSKTLKEESFKSLAWAWADEMVGQSGWPASLAEARILAEQKVADKRKELSTPEIPAEPGKVRKALGIDKKIQEAGKNNPQYYSPEKHIHRDERLIEALRTLKEHYPNNISLAVITNQPRSIAQRILRKLGVDEVIDAVFTDVVSPDGKKLEKPDPEILKHAAQALGVPIENAVAIGDEQEKDIKPADDIGMPAVRVQGPQDIYSLSKEIVGPQPSSPLPQRPEAASATDIFQFKINHDFQYPRYIVLMGKPFSGKGAAAFIYSTLFGLPIINMGDLLKKEINGLSGLGIKSVGVNEGKLAPLSVKREVLLKQFEKMNVVENGFILDGTPREMGEVEIIMDYARQHGFDKKIKFIVLDAEDETVEANLNRKIALRLEKLGEHGILEQQLHVFGTQTREVINHLSQHPSEYDLLTIPANESFELVFQDILDRLEKADETLLMRDDPKASDSLTEEVGGIDLNPELLGLETQGQGIEFDIPIDWENMDAGSISGFTPVIYQMVPMTGLPGFLGAADDHDKSSGADRSLSRLPADVKERRVDVVEEVCCAG